MGASGSCASRGRHAAPVEARQRVRDAPDRGHVRRRAEQRQRHHHRHVRRQRAVAEQRLDDRRQAADDAEVEQPLRPLHRADVHLHAERLAARAGVADHDRADRRDERHVDRPAAAVVDGQAAEDHELGVAVHDAVEEGAALGHPAGGAGDASIEDVEDAGQEVEPAAGAEAAGGEADRGQAGDQERREGQRVGRHPPADERALPRAEDPHDVVAQVAPEQLRSRAARHVGVHRDADPASAQREQTEGDDEVGRQSEQRVQRQVGGMHPRLLYVGGKSKPEARTFVTFL